jgi:hypothetical protein
MLYSRPVVYLLRAFPAFADSVMADPTFGGQITDPNSISALLHSAIEFKLNTMPALSNQVAFLQPLLSSTTFNTSDALWAATYYANIVTQQAQNQFNAGNYAGALATATPLLSGSATMQAVTAIFQSKIALRSPDVLSWAKLVYFIQPFPQTQVGIDAVASAFRSVDTNLVRDNAFIQFEESGTGANPLAGVPLPSGVTFIGNSPDIQAANFATAGDNLDALKTAVNQFSTAANGYPLNNATAAVAQWLRNIDGNLVRANAFVTAQSAGQPYTIAELQPVTTGTAPIVSGSIGGTIPDGN